VHNCSETTVSCSMTALGLIDAVAEETITMVEETVNDRADATESTGASLATGIGGSVTGSRAGAFDSHMLSYVGEGTTVTLTHGVLAASFASDVAGNDTIAIHNYAERIAVSYSLAAM
jgi:hypothetical protein